MRTLLLLSGTALLLPLLAAHAQVRQVDLAEMVQSSGMIFSGQVLSVEGTTDERGDVVTRTTFQVEQPIRGVIPGSVTITQYGGVTESGASMVLAHMRYFTPGERVLVLLYPPSELGFTSPIGMGQGVWSIDRNGDVLGLGAHLFAGIETLTSTLETGPNADGTMPLTSMIKLITALAEGGQ